jgi:hypothetical protein
MGNGLIIDEAEFMSLKPKEQMCVLYRNSVENLRLTKNYKFNQKIIYAWLGILTVFVGAGKFLGVI